MAPCPWCVDGPDGKHCRVVDKDKNFKEEDCDFKDIPKTPEGILAKLKEESNNIFRMVDQVKAGNNFMDAATMKHNLYLIKDKLLGMTILQATLKSEFGVEYQAERKLTAHDIIMLKMLEKKSERKSK
jgi:hypothetical protein